MEMTYTDSLHKHAVTHLNTVQKYWYDGNGNMTRREENGNTYLQSCDAENRLTGVTWGTNNSAAFTYDGDGKRVKSSTTVNGITTITAYVGNYLEWKTSTSDMVKYYFAGGQRIGMRKGNGAVTWLLSDQLGCTTVSTQGGMVLSETHYKPWGGTLYTYSSLPTKNRFTGQIEEPDLGLYFYNARYYDAYLNRWVQPDSIVPDPYNPQDYDRYSYVRNNSVNFNDPTGHLTDEQILKWTDFRSIGEIPDEYYAFLQGLMLGDTVFVKNPTDPWGSYRYDEVGLTDGHLSFSHSNGTTYSLSDWMKQGYDLKKAVITRSGLGTVYDNGAYKAGFKTTTSSTVNVDGWGRAGVLAGGVAVATVGTAATACVYGLVFGAVGCGVAAPIGAAIGFVVSFGVSLAVDGPTSNPGTVTGDTAYSYTFENGQSYTVIVRNGQVMATSNIFTTNQAELIANGLLNKYK